nr:MAG TPA: hypothetical protein [Caudoviricetes sp.]
MSRFHFPLLSVVASVFANMQRGLLLNRQNSEKPYQTHSIIWWYDCG